MRLCTKKSHALTAQASWQRASARGFRGRNFRGLASGGFTLLEALLALLLVAVVLPALMGAVRSSVRMAALAEDRAFAMQLAEAKMQEILIDEAWRETVATGRFEEHDAEDSMLPSVSEQDPRDWRWEMAVAPWQDLSTSQVGLVVIWDRWGRERYERLDTVVHNTGGL